VVTALANLPLPHTTGPVFYYTKTTDRHARRYAYRSIGPTNSGQIKSGFEATLKRAGLDGLGLTPHCLRHTFASWHYAVWRDPLKLKIEGGWESSQMVERYMHLMPTGQQAEILRFWGYRVDDTKLAPATEAAYLSA
jgi:integrase